GQEERAALLAVLNLDHRPQGHRAAGAERRRAEDLQHRDLRRRALGALGLPARQAALLERHARVLALLRRGAALARLPSGARTCPARHVSRREEVVRELLDEEPFVHTLERKPAPDSGQNTAQRIIPPPPEPLRGRREACPDSDTPLHGSNGVTASSM